MAKADPRSSSQRGHSQSLRRGLAVLACFTAEQPILGVAELADALGMSRSTTHRYVATLQQLGYLEQLQSDRRYRLGLKVTDLGLSALCRTRLVSVAQPQMQILRRRTRLAVGLAVLDGTEIVYLQRLSSYKWAGDFTQRRPLYAGSRLPACSTAVGKVLLGDLEEIGINDEEDEIGCVAIAVGVRDDRGEVIAALSVIGAVPEVSVRALLHDHRPVLEQGAQHISQALGYLSE